MKNKTKMTIQLWLGFFLAAFGVIMLIASFIVPPMGIIDASVLAATGEVFTFSGALIGIDYHYRERHNEHIHLYHSQTEEEQTTDNQ